MSYLRAPLYVWRDDDRTHIWRREDAPDYDHYRAACGFPAGVALPNDVFDAICLMRVAEIERSHNRKRAERRALRYAGNYGSAALYARLGLIPPWRVDQAGE